MPRDASGIYTLPPGNPVQSGTTISTTWANPTLEDIATSLTDSLSRNGNGDLLAPLRGPDGSAAAPTFSFTNEISTGRYRPGAGEVIEVVQGQNVIRYTQDGLYQWIDGAWQQIAQQDALEVPYDNSGTNFTSDNVGDVLSLELATLYPVVPIANGGSGTTTATGTPGSDNVLATAPRIVNADMVACTGTLPPTSDDSGLLATTEWYRNQRTILTVSGNANGYYRLYTDGFLVQWGKHVSGPGFLNYPTSFIDSNTVVVTMSNYASGITGGTATAPCVTDAVSSAGGVSIGSGYSTVWWIAMGDSDETPPT